MQYNLATMVNTAQAQPCISSDLALALSAYVPRWVRDRVTCSKPVAPGYNERFEAAVLFCDLAGFTALTEALGAGETADKRGQGVEQLQAILDQLFTAIIDVAHAYGGDIVRFSGDALSVLFGDESTSGECARHTQRALACALAMQRAIAPLANFQLGGTPYPLQMKIGLGAGRVLAVMLGHPEHGQDMLLTGPALAAATEGEKRAQGGEVLASSEALRRACLELPGADGFAALRPDDSSLAALDLPDPVHDFDLWDFEPGESGQQLASFVPPAIVERLQLKMGQHLPEFKRVTAVFVAFAGPDYGSDPQAAAKVQAYVNAAQELIAHYKGRLVEIEAGDKGSLLLVVFGAPLADERDTIHAAQCALALRALPATLRVGLATGQVFAGTVGAPLRKRYTTIGAAVNRAARLMQTATAGQILADQDTVALSSRAIAYTSLPPVKLKGIAEPAPIYSLDGEQADELARAGGGRLIGRQDELARLLQKLELAGRQQAQLVTLEGEAGVGKTRLAIELRLRALEAGWNVLAGVCQSIGAQTPYLPWSELLRKALDVQPGASPEAQVASAASALRAIDAQLVERLPLLGPVLRLPIADNELTRHLDARLRHDGAFELVTALLRAWLGPTRLHPLSRGEGEEASQNGQAGASLLIVIEDAQWADPLSLELAAHVVRELADEALCILIVQRPHLPPLPPAYAALRGLPAHSLLQLGPLPAGQGSELASASLGVTALPPEIEQLVVERGQGNPFFVEEIARALRESGALTRDPDSGELLVSGEMAQIQIPDTVEKLVQGRIDQLDEGSRLTLKVASVIGQEFHMPVLRGAYPPTVILDDLTLLEQLDKLEQRDLTQLEIPEPVLAYLFKHLITREVTYESLLFAQRRALHEAVARWYERTYAAELSPHYALLAYHYERTENYARQLEYFTLAGQQAAKDYANDAAREFFSKALGVAARVPQAGASTLAAIHEGLGDLDDLAGEFERANAHYEQAYAALESQACEDTYLPLARLHRKMGRVREQQGDIPAAFEHLESGLQFLAAHGDEPASAQEMARLYVQGSLTHTRRGDLELAMEWASKALQAVQKYDFPAELAQIYNLFAVIRYMCGDNKAAIEYGQQSASLYERLGDKLGASKAYSNLGVAYSHECDWDASLRYYQQSLHLRREIGDATGVGFVYNNLGNIYLWQGADLNSAILALKQAEQIGLESGRHQITLGAQDGLGEAHLRLGQVDLAVEYIQKGLALAEKTGIQNLSPRLSRSYAEVYLTKGEFDVGEEWARRALQLAEEQGQRDVAGEAWCTLGRLHRLRGEWEQAKEVLRQSRAILQELNLQRQLGQTILELARLRRDQGQVNEAQETLEEATTIFRRVDAQWDLRQAEEEQIETKALRSPDRDRDVR
ncbi:MAG: tetratricopeptide repeat protein [Thermoflexales bacterium]|nr:tetratricopeptide repeat protein [Thermoflexales bacterium]